jgi:hypothetical protein
MSYYSRTPTILPRLSRGLLLAHSLSISLLASSSRHAIFTLPFLLLLLLLHVLLASKIALVTASHFLRELVSFFRLNAG